MPFQRRQKNNNWSSNKPGSYSSRQGGFGRSRSGRPRNTDSQKFSIRKMVESSKTEQAAAVTEGKEFIAQHAFNDFDIAPKLKSNIESRGYEQPTPIQDQVIPLVLQGKDVVGIANTGTGKSAAFLIPLLDQALRNTSSRVLVIVPTRELAQQLHQELKAFSPGTNVHAVTCVGGININGQINNLRRQHNFVIGTPGRLKDLVNRGDLQLNHYSTVVLDEVDRMLDMGFINDMEVLIGKLPQQRQSLFFSATMTPQVEKVMLRFVKDYVKVSVKSTETSHNISQTIIEVSSSAEKMTKLKDILSSEDLSKAIVFVRTKRGADRLSKGLFSDGYKVDAIHGDKRQSQRQRVLESFKAGRLKTLIATDVAARGLDIADISHVINFDLPETLDDYVHRIGRTGRGDKKGRAITFIEAGGSMHREY